MSASPPTTSQPRIVMAQHWGQPVRFVVADADDLIQGVHATGAFYEPEELDIIRQHCRLGSVFCDIGANVGNHSLFVGLFLHPEAIIPFEVNPPAIEILRQNLRVNGLMPLCDLRFLGTGLSDRRATGAGLSSPAGNLGGTRVRGAGGDIALAPGDELLDGRRVDFLKIDVEGMEMSVLSGLEQSIAAHRPRIFVEVENAHVAALQDWAQARDYRVVDQFRRYPGNINLMLVSRHDPARQARRRHDRRLRRIIERRAQRKAESGKQEAQS